MSEIEILKEIDAVGAMCPGPLMELVKVIKEIEVGDVISLLSSDEGSKVDVPKWIEKAGHELLEVRESERDGKTVRAFIVKKGEKKERRRRR